MAFREVFITIKPSASSASIHCLSLSKLPMSSIATSLAAIGRELPAHVRLLAVSKTFPAQDIQTAWQAGQSAFGENYVQEAVEKIIMLAPLRQASSGATPPIEWHLIGPVQSNKTALIARHFDWVQTIDRLKIAQRLSAQRPPELPALQVCLQVNVDGGTTKSGIDCLHSPQAALDMACQIACLPALTLRGLLAIPEPSTDPQQQYAVFCKVKAVFDAINAQAGLLQPLDTLSMGMSADYPAAIAAGATMVRIGSAIFGQRAPAQGSAPNH